MRAHENINILNTTATLITSVNVDMIISRGSATATVQIDAASASNLNREIWLINLQTAGNLITSVAVRQTAAVATVLTVTRTAASNRALIKCVPTGTGTTYEWIRIL